MSPESQPRNKEYYDELVGELEVFVLRDKSLPRAVVMIINLLREGKIKSAIDTFKWEEDKMVFHKEVVSLLKAKLN